MHVIRHHDPIVQHIFPLVKMKQGFGNYLRYVRPAEMAFADAAIKITLDLSAKLAMDFLRIGGLGVCGKTTKRFSVFTFKAKQHLFRQ